MTKRAITTIGLMATLGLIFVFLSLSQGRLNDPRFGSSRHGSADDYENDFGHAKPPPPPPPPPGHFHPGDPGSENYDQWTDNPSGQSQHQSDTSYVKGLSDEEFAEYPLGTFLDSEQQRNRYESLESWRIDNDAEIRLHDKSHDVRPVVASWNHYQTKAQYLQQLIPADYAEGAEDVFLMIKEGSNVLWDRLPIHLLTTLTRVPNYAIYGDAPNSIAGIEVIDIFQNVTQETYDSPQFEMYRRMRELHNTHSQFDTSQLKMDGGWDLDKFKNLPMLYNAWKRSPESHWFIFMDGDSYIMLDTLIKELNKKFDYKDQIYYGSGAMLADQMFAHGGSGVVLSQGAMKAAFEQENVEELLRTYEKATFDYCCGDFMVALFLLQTCQIGLTTAGGVIQGNPIWDVYFHEDRWCKPLSTFHHLNSHDIEILWEYEKLRGPHKNNITYSSIYRDFLLPYLAEELEDWDNMATAMVFNEEEYSGDFFSLEDEKSLKPHTSKENCKKACAEHPDCFGWRYQPEGKYCSLDKDIRLGHLSKSYIGQPKDHGQKIYSGWPIDKIRKMRGKTHCDILHSDPNYEGKPDGSENDHVEGWYYRRLTNATAGNSTAVDGNGQ